MTPNTKDKPKEIVASRWFKTKRASEALPSLIAETLYKRGFTLPELVLQWDTVMGAWLAKYTRPDKIRFAAGTRANGTLYITVASEMALAVQHAQHLIIDKVNSLFGYAAISRLVLQQQPFFTLLNTHDKIIQQKKP
jgi:hypothetical protein